MLLGRIRHRRSGRGERGAVLVEAAIILPVLLMLVFGVIEFSIAHWAAGMSDDAIRRSGRQAAQMGRANDFGERIGNIAAEELRRLPGTATPQWILVYKANEDGFPGDSTGDWDAGIATCVAQQTCVKANWDTATQGWGAFDEDAVWNSTSHNVCRNHGQIDRIGVAISLHYTPILGMFNEFLARDTGNGMVRWSVLAFEPIPTVLCE